MKIQITFIWSFRSSCSKVFCIKDFLRNIAKFRGKHLCQSIFFNEHSVKSVLIRSYSGPHFPVFGLNTESYGVFCIQSECGKIRTRITLTTDTFCAVKVQARPATLLKKRLWHSCFPVNFAKFLAIPFLTEHLRWLLLKIQETSTNQTTNKWSKIFKNGPMDLVLKNIR